MIIFLQAFGLSSSGGGPRILRALLQDAPMAWASICANPQPQPPATFGREIQLPMRPFFGRVETTRFSWIPNALEPLFLKRFEQQLEATCRDLAVTAIHSIAHSGDFIHGHRIARRLGVPYFLTIHDDLEYVVAGHPGRKRILESLPAIWRDADQIFVISEPLGEEYSIRYGNRAYATVTDGLDSLPEVRPPPRRSLRIYFMGLFHISYEANLQALLRGITTLRRARPELEISVTCRCGMIRRHVVDMFENITVLPFGSEGDVQDDMRNADLLYLPLPFGDAHKAFVRYSLSTKLIAYLGSGIPIFYHGPKDSAARRLLDDNNAAFVSTILESNEIAATLQRVIDQPDEVIFRVRNAANLASNQFMLSDQRRKFWNGIADHLNPSEAAASRE